MGRSPEPQASARRCGCHHNATCSFFIFIFWFSDLFDRGFFFLFGWILGCSHCGFEDFGVLVLWVGLILCFWGKICIGLVWFGDGSKTTWTFWLNLGALTLWVWDFWRFNSVSSSILWVWGWFSFGILQVTVFKQDHYLHNFVQSTFDALPSDKIKGMVYMSCGMVDQNGNSV